MISRSDKLGEKLLKASLLLFPILSLLLHIHSKFSIKIDVVHILMADLYIKPWIRIAPYLMGALTAIYLQKNGRKAEISEVKTKTDKEVKVSKHSKINF
jgi:hypothetical protein